MVYHKMEDESLIAKPNTHNIVRWQENIDVALIDAFICKIQKEEFNIIGPETFNFCIRDMKKYYLSHNQVNFLIAFVNDDIVGCVGIRTLSLDESELRKFYIHPQYRNVGLGQALFEKAINLAKVSHFKQVYAGTMNIKLKAQAFYKRNHFHEIERSLLPDVFQAQKLDEKFYVLSLV